ncbi:MAG: GyrI-like domain-containing protein [Pseudomonadota bacterium]
MADASLPAHTEHLSMATLSFRTTEPKPIFYRSGPVEMTPQSITPRFEHDLPSLAAFCKAKAIATVPPPMGIYRNAVSEGEDPQMILDVAIGVAEADLSKAEAPVLAGHAPSGHTAFLVHKGSYATLPETYKALFSALSAAGHKPLGTFWEAYLNDPYEVEEADLETEICALIA